VNYRLRDWVFSRQRYWGEPIPIVHCGACGGRFRFRRDQLPVLLPEVAKYEPTGTGESPLAAVHEWVNTVCPRCGGPARRETNTMPQWAGSCWYYLRYIDPKNTSAAWSADAEKYWLGAAGVDLYVGGAEHAVLHLLYARFWHKVLLIWVWCRPKNLFINCGTKGMISLTVIKTRAGPTIRTTKMDFSKTPPGIKSTGAPLRELKEKMSKSKKNVISPDDVIDRHGADAMRLYEMFMGDFEAEKPWDMRTVEGVVRFLQKVWRLWDVPRVSKDKNERARHRTVHAVTERIENFKFNTAIAALMEYANALVSRERLRRIWKPWLCSSRRLPRIWRKRWGTVGAEGVFVGQPWPKADPALVAENTWNIPSKSTANLKDRLSVPVGTPRPRLFWPAARLFPACKRR
jgi:leucyl-tRNA synthetase